MPFIVRYPGKVPAGRVDAESVMVAMDLLSTFCKITNSPVPDTEKLDGVNVSDAWFGKKFVRQQPIYWEYGRNNESFRYPPNAKDVSPNLAIRMGSWKLMLNDDGTNAQLYDLKKDIPETNNVAVQNPKIVQEMSRQLLAWRKSLPVLENRSQ
jgi:arylsulfatase A-like enzyme